MIAESKWFLDLLQWGETMKLSATKMRHYFAMAALITTGIGFSASSAIQGRLFCVAFGLGFAGCAAAALAHGYRIYTSNDRLLNQVFNSRGHSRGRKQRRPDFNKNLT